MMGEAMKKLFVLFCFVGTAISASAQEPAVKATTIMHQDGSRTAKVVNLEERMSEETTYEAGSDRISRRTVYALDENGNPTRSSVYDAKGKLVYKAEFKRNGANQIGEEIGYSPSGQVLRRLVFNYGSDGRVTKVDVYDAQGNLVAPEGQSKSQEKRPRRVRR